MDVTHAHATCVFFCSVVTVVTLQQEKKKGDPTAASPSSSVVAAAPMKRNEKSIILFENADIVLDEDKGFKSILREMAKKAKCPIILSMNQAYDFSW